MYRVYVYGGGCILEGEGVPSDFILIRCTLLSTNDSRGCILGTCDFCYSAPDPCLGPSRGRRLA